MNHIPLAKDHNGLMVDYSGMIKQCSDIIKSKSSFQAELLRQFQVHLSELGRRFYAGDLTVVDQFLQLYCIGKEDRERVVAERNKPAVTASHKLVPLEPTKQMIDAARMFEVGMSDERGDKQGLQDNEAIDIYKVMVGAANAI